MKKIRPFSAFAAAVILCVLGLLLYNGYRSCRMAFYPIKYQQYVDNYAKQNGLSPSFVYAVIRCESSFDPNALSSIGARGLMQLTPETFWWVQGRLKVKPQLSDDALYDPETNIRYGSALLSELISEFGTRETALAAYHAGRSNVKKWLADPRYSHDHVTLYHIPFADTRAYVQKVLRTQEIYRKLYKI